MLILNRNVDQSILIGDQIKIMITGFNPKTGRVCVGVDAPDDMLILRDELKNQPARRPNWRNQCHSSPLP